jgi:hypothetical protein
MAGAAEDARVMFVRQNKKQVRGVRMSFTIERPSPASCARHPPILLKRCLAVRTPRGDKDTIYPEIQTSMASCQRKG